MLRRRPPEEKTFITGLNKIEKYRKTAFNSLRHFFIIPIAVCCFFTVDFRSLTLFTLICHFFLHCNSPHPQLEYDEDHVKQEELQLQREMAVELWSVLIDFSMASSLI